MGNSPAKQAKHSYTEEGIAKMLGSKYGIDRGLDCGPNILMMWTYTTYLKSKWSGWYEADFLYITKTRYLWEVEIKISIQDFRADLRKKHYHDHPDVRGFYYCMPWEMYLANREEVDTVCKDKGAGLVVVDGRSISTQIKPKERRDIPPLDDFEMIFYLRLFAKKWCKEF